MFTRLGYTGAQMADIAREAKIAPGTLYLYVECKEALFWLALSYAAGDPLPEGPFPLPARPIGDVLADLSRRLKIEAHSPVLVAAVNLQTPEDTIELELRAILEERYDRQAAARRLIDVIESSAKSWPELAEVFYVGVRRVLIAKLSEYLRRRIRGGYLRAVPDVQVAARYIIEVVAWFAMHRYGDPDSADISDDAARSATIDLLLHGLLKPPT